MLDFLWGILVFVVRAIDFVLDIAVMFSRMGRLARTSTGQPPTELPDIKLPLNIPTPAAARALAEAEQRHRDDPKFFDKYGSASQKRTT